MHKSISRILILSNNIGALLIIFLLSKINGSKFCLKKTLIVKVTSKLQSQLYFT